MLESFGELLTGIPEVWEDWREIYGSHTCDKRSTRVSPPISLSTSPTADDDNRAISRRDSPRSGSRTGSRRRTRSGRPTIGRPMRTCRRGRVVPSIGYSGREGRRRFVRRHSDVVPVTQLRAGSQLITLSDISVTSHSAIFRNTLAVLGHAPYPLATGEMIPIVIKATRVDSSGLNGVNGVWAHNGIH
jgi:hypothetical protein